MSYGISQDPFTIPGAVDKSKISREQASPPSIELSEESVARDRKENTTFEWASTSSAGRDRGALGIEFDGHGLIVIGAQRDRRAEFMIDHVLVTRFDERPDSSLIAARLRSFVRRQSPDVHLVLSTPRAVVRHFTLPAVPTRQRVAAGLWEGQKLVPFSLKDGAALYGIDFAAAGERGWKTTLVAVPTEDAAPILDAIDALGWTLRSVSLVGTQRFNDDATTNADDVTATVTWSDQRGCFAVYHRRQLVFQYDLGPLPSSPPGMKRGISPESMPTWQRWIDGLGVSVSDALDFHLNLNPSIPPSTLRFYGLPLEAAPLFTEWSTRFPSGVILGDPLSGCQRGLPEGVLNWLTSQSGVIAPVMAALSGTVGVDLTPERIRERRTLHKWESVTRSLCVLSAVVCTAWSGLIWLQSAGRTTEGDRAREAVMQLQTSEVSVKLDDAVGTAAHGQLLLSSASEPGAVWMPWFKTVLGALPDNAHLLHTDIEHRGSVVVAHLEGTLSPASIGHAMTYREWFDRLRTLCSAAPVLASERTIDVLGAKHSAFTVELVAPSSLSPFSERQK